MYTQNIYLSTVEPDVKRSIQKRQYSYFNPCFAQEALQNPFFMLYTSCFPSYTQDYIFHKVAPANIELIQLYFFFVSTILLSVLRFFLLFLKREKRNGVGLWLEVLQLVMRNSGMLHSL